MDERQFVKGVKITLTKTRYGDFYCLGVNKEKFLQNPDNKGWVNFAIKTSKEGNPYGELSR